LRTTIFIVPLAANPPPRGCSEIVLDMRTALLSYEFCPTPQLHRASPRLEFICVNRFSQVMFREASSQIAGRSDIGLVREIFAS
jgi:hypothetical protein